MRETSFTLEGTVKVLLEAKKYTSLKDMLLTMNPADIAEVCNTLGKEHLALTFRLLSKDLAAETFSNLEPETQEQLIRSLSDTELKQVVNELYTDDAVSLVDDMPANVVKRILAQADPELRRDINEILRYPENSAGSVMTTEYVALTPEMTLEDSITFLRKTGVDKETIYTCYVVEQGKLVGFVTLKDLLMTQRSEATIRDIMDEHVISCCTGDDREQIAQMLSKYNFIALPVVDSDNRLVGIVTFDDAMDVLEEETTEDIQKMAAILPSEKTYLRSSPLDLFKHRILWLLLLMVSATFTGMIITDFENALAAQVALTAFIPMLMDTGGNSGSQASVTVIRALSLGELDFSDLPSVIWKELRTSLLCGGALGIACFLKIVLIDMLLLGNTSVTLPVTFVVCLAMVTTVVVAKLIGCMLPMLAKKLSFDPAVMASPFITTIVDATSLLFYFGIARVLLKL